MSVDQLWDRVAAIRALYERWEKRTASRFDGWSVRRRWGTFVLVPTLLVCCVGTAFGVPAAWLLNSTLEASRGAPSPDAAANDYLMALGYDNEDGLLPVLDNDHQDELLTGWRSYRAAMNKTTPPPAKLEFGALTVGPIVNGQAEVSTEVSATWWGTTSYSSEAHTWHFKTREGNGWQVQTVEPFTWCGGYVRSDACG